MAGKAVISLTTGLEDPEKVTVAFLVAVGAAESGRPTVMFQAKEAVRLALDGVAAGVACDGCPALPDLLVRYERAGGRAVHGLPGLLQRQAARQGQPDHRRRTGRQRPAVGVDRRRRRDDVQLLISGRGGPGADLRGFRPAWSLSSSISLWVAPLAGLASTVKGCGSAGCGNGRVDGRA